MKFYVKSWDWMDIIITQAHYIDISLRKT